MLCGIFFAVAISLRWVQAVDPLIDVSYTRYQGTSLPNGISQWLGIRYAAPPVGSLRFAAPQDPPSDGSIQLANEVLSKVHPYSP